MPNLVVNLKEKSRERSLLNQSTFYVGKKE